MPIETITVGFGETVYKPPVATLEVEAEILGDLAIHRDCIGPASERSVVKPAVDPDGGWTITHVPSGFSVKNALNSPYSARIFAKSIADLDWSGTVEEVVERNRGAVQERWEAYISGELSE